MDNIIAGNLNCCSLQDHHSIKCDAQVVSSYIPFLKLNKDLKLCHSSQGCINRYEIPFKLNIDITLYPYFNMIKDIK